MSVLLTPEVPPLSREDDGTIRVGASRVTLELVVGAYRRGLLPERIAEDFDTLELADIYAVIAYALRHPREVEEYLTRREVEARELRARIEAAQPLFPTKAELLARLL